MGTSLLPVPMRSQRVLVLNEIASRYERVISIMRFQLWCVKTSASFSNHGMLRSMNIVEIKKKLFGITKSPVHVTNIISYDHNLYMNHVQRHLTAFRCDNIYIPHAVKLSYHCGPNEQNIPFLASLGLRWFNASGVTRTEYRHMNHIQNELTLLTATKHTITVWAFKCLHCTYQ